jgi:hypothetical protein
MTQELGLSAFLLTALYLIYLVTTLCISYCSCTCWVPTISVLNLAIFPYYSNLLLRRKRWTRILWQGVLGYVLPRLPFLWSYGVFHYSVSLRVIIVFRDTIYVIIIPYSWHLVICDYFWPYMWNNWSWVMHTMSTWFWHKNRVWQCTWHHRGGRVEMKLKTDGSMQQAPSDSCTPQLFHFHCIRS